MQEVCGCAPPQALTNNCGFTEIPQLEPGALVGRSLIQYLLYQGLFEEGQPPTNMLGELDLAVDWLTAIFQWDPATRPTMQDILAHPWLASS